MVRLGFSIELNYQVADAGCDFIFNIHAAQTRQQHVLGETLGISQILQPDLYTDPVSHNRYLKFRAAPGPLESRITSSQSPPRFKAFRDRAWSIRICRIAVAATAQKCALSFHCGAV